MYALEDLSTIATSSEPLSPELVLVTPELRAEAIRRLRPPPPRLTPPPPPESDRESALRTLCGTVEVTARVPVVVTLAIWAAIGVARVALVIGLPVLLLVTLAALLGH
jgi:hypothetical protein